MYQNNIINNIFVTMYDIHKVKLIRFFANNEKNETKFQKLTEQKVYLKAQL